MGKAQTKRFSSFMSCEALDKSAPVRAQVIAQPDLKPCNVSPSFAPIFLRYIFKWASAAAEVKGES